MTTHWRPCRRTSSRACSTSTPVSTSGPRMRPGRRRRSPSPTRPSRLLRRRRLRRRPRLPPRPLRRARSRMNLRRALLAAFALAAAALLVPALAHAYSPQNADVAVQVAPTGALLVTEKITIGGAYHGAYRDIPLRQGESIDRLSPAAGGRPYTRGGSTKLGSIDRSDTFNYETNEKRVRIVWHFLAAGEPRTYTI